MDEEKTCECGRVWGLTKHSVIDRESDSIECKCGRTLKRWNGACFWSAELVKDLEPIK
jgi:hypothetical protein